MSVVTMRDACATWKEMHKLYLRMQGTAMQLFQHPDATDAQILEVARKLGQLREQLSVSRQQITKHKFYHAVAYRHGIEGFIL